MGFSLFGGGGSSSSSTTNNTTTQNANAQSNTAPVVTTQGVSGNLTVSNTTTDMGAVAGGLQTAQQALNDNTALSAQFVTANKDVLASVVDTMKNLFSSATQNAQSAYLAASLSNSSVADKALSFAQNQTNPNVGIIQQNLIPIGLLVIGYMYLKGRK